MGKGSKTKVPRYFRSMHLGVCHGPIQSVNQLWIKERKVFCQRVMDPSVVYVNRPNLFGGDTKEGGVRGVAELYFGTAEQVASKHVSARYGRTPDEMPAGRGIASVFLRGATPDEEDLMPEDVQSLVTFSPFSTVADLFDAVADTARRGWRWITNNPYQPSAWVHVTRLPGEIAGVSTSSAVTAAVMKGAIYTQGGNVPTSDAAPVYHTYVIPRDPRTPRVPVTVTVEMAAQFEYNGIFGLSGPVDSLNIAYVRAFDGDGAQVFADNVSETNAVLVIHEIPTTADTLQIACVQAPNAPWVYVNEVLRYARYDLSMEVPGLLPLCANSPDITAPPDANPALMIAECWADPSWGAAYDVSEIDAASIQSAAEVLYSESFGLSMIYTKPSAIQDFISEIQDHIQAIVFQDCDSGLMTLRLIRDDYDPDDLDVLTEDDVTFVNPSRKAMTDLVNEVTVEYRDYKTEERRSVTVANPAAKAQLGYTNAVKRDYYGIRHEALARRVAERDLISAGADLFSCEIHGGPALRKYKPGGCVKIASDEDGIESMVVRVFAVDHGDLKSQAVVLHVTEDVFAREQTIIDASTDTIWQDGTEPDELVSLVTTSTPLAILRSTGFNDTDAESDEGIYGLSVLSVGSAGRAYSVMLTGDVSNNLGDTETGVLAEVPTTSRTVLADALVAEVETSIPAGVINTATGLRNARKGDYLYLAGTSDADGEIVQLRSKSAGVWVVARGMLDTVPRSWPAGTVMLYMGQDGDYVATHEFVSASDTVVTYTALTPAGDQTGGGIVTLTENHMPRHAMPTRPANVYVSAVGGPGPDRFAVVGFVGKPDEIEFGWETRNRLSEDAMAPLWDDVSALPEIGQTVLIRVYAADDYTGSPFDVPALELSGLTGTSAVASTDDLESNTLYYAFFFAEREGLKSIQAARRDFMFAAGYGNAYGYGYGV